jgi:hypothetical protein
MCSSQCSYVVDIDVHVPWAPDIEVRLPLIVKPSIDEVVSLLYNFCQELLCLLQWKAWHPPEWVNRCTREEVTGMCAVPQDIIGV